jgi:hypothetical protein
VFPPWILAGEAIWITDANPGHGKRYIVRADEKLTASLEVENQCQTPEKSDH